MSPLERSGGESAVPTRSQAALDNWQNVQINRRCSPRRGYRSASYRDSENNRDFTITPSISPFSEYVDYNKDVILFCHAPEPIEEDKTWRLVGGNTNSIKPYGGSADLISVMERLKLIQTGTVACQETNLEWHNESYQDEFKKLLAKAFGAARVDYSTTKASLKRRLSNQVELQVQRWEKWCIEWLRPTGTTPAAAASPISHSMEKRIITLQLSTPIEYALSATRVTQPHPDRNSAFSMQMKS
jgi:hypothetical protein